VFLSICYVALQRVLHLVVLRFCSRFDFVPREFKELEIAVLRHELALLRRRAHEYRFRSVNQMFAPFGVGTCVTFCEAPMI